MSQLNPTPAELDTQAKKYEDLKEQVLQAKLAYSDLQTQLEAQSAILVDLVTKHGGAHAEKSKILHGVKFEALCTYGQTVKIDPAAVETFRLALVEADKPRLLTKMFEKRIAFALNPQASVIIRSEKLSDELTALWAKCELIQPKAPVLKVREKSA